ncbi:MAG: hypothetical protein V9E85_12985 [Candidatus Nanopelagicales bacterium]
MIPPLDASGKLPRGRFVCDLDEFTARFRDDVSFAQSATRAEVFREFQTVHALLARRKLPIPAAFISGSFVTDKIDPSDLDVAFIVDCSQNPNSLTLTAIQALCRKAKERKLRGPASEILRVDALLILWDAQPIDTLMDVTYCAPRGKWDDFWQRDVPKDLREPPERWHAMPQRGYLEVTLDGYV